MDAITNTVGKIGGAGGNPTTMGGIGEIAKLLTGIFGTIGNIKTANRANTISEGAAAQQKKLASIAANPQELARLAASVRQPLSLGLTEGVGNAAQGEAASRGLSSSPQQFEAILAQMLAPYEQHSQDTAMNAVLQLLGLPLEGAKTAAGTLPKESDTSAFWKMFLPNANPSGSSTTPSSTSGSSTPGITIPDMQIPGNPGPFEGGGEPSPFGL